MVDVDLNMGVTFMMVLAWVSTEVWLASVVVLSRLSWCGCRQNSAEALGGGSDLDVGRVRGQDLTHPFADLRLLSHVSPAQKEDG